MSGLTITFKTAEYRNSLNRFVSELNADGRVLLSVRPANQKCSAIQFQITEFVSFGDGSENPVADYGRGHELVSIDLEIGVKSGTGRRILSADSKR